MPSLSVALGLAQQAIGVGDIARAQYIYEQILQAVPEDPQALDGLGLLYLQAGQLEAAEELVRRAIVASPAAAMFHHHLSLVLRQQGRDVDTIASCRRAVELDPRAPELHNALGIALQEARSFADAITSFRESLARNPDCADVHYNLARTWALLGLPDEAENEYRRTIELAPSDYEAYNNLGLLLQAQGHFSDAMACYEATLRVQPNSAEAHFNRASLRLLLGDFAQGWPEYEWRLRKPGVTRPDYSQPRWEGQPLSDRTILLWPEQGVGDVIQFVRYAALVKQAGARVLVGCPASLHALLKTAPGVDRVTAGGTDGEAFDYYIPLMSLPGMLGTTLATIPRTIPYLHAEPERVEHFRKRLGPDRNFDFKVGIAWQGDPKFAGDNYRSVPLAHFEPLAGCDGVTLISLQKGHGREQLAALAEQLHVVDLAATLDEDGQAFVDTAAVMMNLDLIVTSDTSIAHLAGALGVPVWVALPLAPDWRWLANRDDSPWYPTMRLFRQSRLGDWADVFAEIAGRLRSLSTGSRLE